MLKIISKIRLRANDKLTNLKKKIRKSIIVFKEKVREKKEKGKSRSKLKSYLLGFGTVLSIFGIFSSSLPVHAKDLPSAPAPAKQSDEIVGALAGAAATVCATAVTSGSFLIGAACGIIVAIGILKAQGK